jgi:tight adherence protein C
VTTRLPATALRVAAIAAASGGLALALGAGPLRSVGAVVLTGAASVWLGRRRRVAAGRTRQRALTAVLPDAVDLLAATVDGGAAPDVALARVAEFVDEPLRSVLRAAAAADAGAGPGLGTRLCALDPALRPLGSLLQQSEELGVPIAGALRLLAHDARARARAAAREQAAAAAPKLLLVVGGLLAPASLLIVIGGQVLVLRELAGTVLS